MTFGYLVDVDAVHPGDAVLHSAPLSHGAGLYNFMGVLRGARHVIPQSGAFDPAEVSVVGRPSREWGEEAVAFVVAKPGAELDLADLDRLCLEHIARVKRPRCYFVEAELPKNNYGKVLKTELRARLHDPARGNAQSESKVN